MYTGLHQDSNHWSSGRPLPGVYVGITIPADDLMSWGTAVLIGTVEERGGEVIIILSDVLPIQLTSTPALLIINQ